MANDKLWMLHNFDNERCRHQINGLTAVLHCHHFASLTVQLTNDCQLLDAKKLLSNCAEDTFYHVLTNYYRQFQVSRLKDRISIAESYFAYVGLGKMIIQYAGPYSGEVVLEHSHADEGWVNKFGITAKPINYIGCGYITAVFSAIHDRGRREYSAIELKSIACGDDVSVIQVIEALYSGGVEHGNRP